MPDKIPGLGVASLSLLLCLILSATVASAREISGVVTHAVSKEALSKLELSCGRIDEPWPELRVQTPSFLERIAWADTATNEQGEFSFSAEADGRWIIVTRDSHYTFPRGYVVVTLGLGEAPAPLELVVCDGARREVSVFGPDGRTPLDHPENVRLVMDPTNPEIRPDMYVVKPAHELPLARIVGKYQGDGVVVLGPAPPGYYELYSTPDDGFRFAKVDQRVDRSLEGAPLQWKEWRKRTLRCMPVPLMQAKFILPDGRPAAGAEANLLTQPNWMNGLRTDANGVLRFDQDEQLPLGNVRISLSGYAGVFKPEQFSTDPTAAPWMLEEDNLSAVKSAVIMLDEATQDEAAESAQAPLRTAIVLDGQGYPLADAVVTLKPMENLDNNMKAMVAKSDGMGKVQLPYTPAPFAVRIAHEAYLERAVIIELEDLPKPDANISLNLPCSSKLTVLLTRGEEHEEHADVLAFPTDVSIPPMQSDAYTFGKHMFYRAVAGANTIGVTTSEILGGSTFLHTRFTQSRLPIHEEVEVTIDLNTGNANLLLDGDVSRIEAVVFHMKRDNVINELETYRWKRDGENIVPHLSGLPTGSAYVYIDYGNAGFDYQTVTLKEGETSPLKVGLPDMLSMRYKLKAPLDFDRSRIQCVARPAVVDTALIPLSIYNAPAAVGGWVLAASEIANAIDEFELRVPRGVELGYSVEETWRDTNLRSVMPDYSKSHPIVYSSRSKGSALIVLETAANPTATP